MAEFCVHERHGGVCEKTKTYCNLGACPYENMKEFVTAARGRWERRRNVWYCTNCGKGYKITYGAVAANMHNYCPHCGAKMDGGAEDEVD